uniref:Lipoprotein n=1 Tax=Candidatus Kentrum sp. MB TaxID=2138164 RepID=A0A450XGJ9_9GAMM|nr:MAG: hypothetical protein BECKMB1821G_GA0114241_10375 [Candidatus Kentron sp. MB]VFK32836.1 MAG: hypothetical protein BECKMB1821I_GA0114274_10374 [Candidatus Kentron sp. MB]VFK75944.1 MAG: hypothetical protein BECKMB1821H_GA0114242_103623 [Candidatus Kentron sp. MB]
MIIKKTLTIFFVISIFFLSACVTTGSKPGGFSRVGPPLSSSLSRGSVDRQGIARPRLDVVVPVFDPGLPKDSDDYEEEGIWPELRKAEANRFALKLKEALDKTGRFGAVRVTPDQSATGDLYILGKVQQSNGEEVEFDLEVLGIDGEVWLDESFEYQVKEYFHKNQRNKGKDAYAPIFQKAANRIANALTDHSAKDLADLHYLSDLRFGANFSDSAFMQYMNMEDGEITLTSKPSKNDPMLKRVRALRVRDQLFVDGLQTNYAAFSRQMDKSYLVWQEQSLLEVKAERKAREKAQTQAIGGALLIGLGVLSAVAGNRSDSSSGSTMGTAGAVVGGVAGAALLHESFKTSQEAKVHRDAINELGGSMNMELAPQVIRYEKKTVKLTGDAKQQFAQWRAFLKKIYEQEATPDVQL